MSCFPFFMELEGKSILIAGGGRVALGKIEKLLPYGPCLTVAAPEIAGGISVLKIWRERTLPSLPRQTGKQTAKSPRFAGKRAFR